MGRKSKDIREIGARAAELRELGREFVEADDVAASTARLGRLYANVPGLEITVEPLTGTSPTYVVRAWIQEIKR